jgi:hypothetical protein
MKKYFYSDGTNKLGPFTIEELKEKGITKETPISFPDVKDCIPAGKIPELSGLFNDFPTEVKEENKEFTDVLIKTLATGATEKVSYDWYKKMVKQYGEEKYSIISYLDEHGNRIDDKSNLVEKERPPKTYLTESILVTLFCCVPFGIAGIVNAAKVETLFYGGNIEGAEKSSANAKKWTSWGFWCGLVIGVIYLIITIANAANEF